MILRRLAESVRKQEWFTVLLEILIVVIGIFIGLQADDWNQARVEQAEESEYLSRLAVDLRSSVDTTRYQITWMSENAAWGNLIMQSLESCKLPETLEQGFANGVYRIGKIAPVYLVRSTIEELTSNGKLATISNHELKHQINEMIQEYQDHRDILVDLRGRLAPHINYIDSQVGIRVKEPIGGLSKVDFVDLNMVFDSACKDRRLLMAVTAATNYTWDQVHQTTRVLKTLESLEANLSTELSN